MKWNSIFNIIIISAIALLFRGVSSLSAQSPFIGLKIPKLFLSREDEKKSYQDSVIKIIPEYFLLGTLKFTDKLKENRVDCYYADESSLLTAF